MRGDGGTRGLVAALDVKNGNELWRWYVVPKTGIPRKRNVERRSQRMENARRHLADRSYDPAQRLYIFGTGNPFRFTTRSSVPATTCTPIRPVALNIDTGKPACTSSTREDSWDYDEVGVTPFVRHHDRRREAQSRGHYGRNGFFYSLDRVTGKFIKGEKYVNDAELDKGIHSAHRHAARIRPQPRRADLQSEARALRGDGKEARMPDVARRCCATSHSPIIRSRTSPTAWAPRVAFTQTGAASCRSRKTGDVDMKASQAAPVLEPISTMARLRVRHRHTKCWRRPVPKSKTVQGRP